MKKTHKNSRKTREIKKNIYMDNNHLQNCAYTVWNETAEGGVWELRGCCREILKPTIVEAKLWRWHFTSDIQTAIKVCIWIIKKKKRNALEDKCPVAINSTIHQ